MINKEKSKEEYERLGSKSKQLFLELASTYCLKKLYAINHETKVILSFQDQQKGSIASFQFLIENGLKEELNPFYKVSGIKRADTLGVHYRFEMENKQKTDYIVEHHYHVNEEYFLNETVRCSARKNDVVFLAFQNKKNEFDTITIAPTSKNYLLFRNETYSCQDFFEITLEELGQKRSI